MVGLALRTRETGATATLQGQEKPVIRSLTGGELTLENTVSGEGFNAIDLLYASLSACLVMSARIAARKLGLIERINSYEVQVSGEKTAQEPYRITRFDVVFRIAGELSDTERHDLAEAAEAMCTVSNTLKVNADVTMTIRV